METEIRFTGKVSAAPRQLTATNGSLSVFDIRNYAQYLFMKYNITGWHFTILANEGQTKRLGVCNYGNKTISLSHYCITTRTQIQIQDVVLHEIAHALVGPGHGHDSVWKAKCRQIGAIPKSCSNDDNRHENSDKRTYFRYVGKCPDCGNVYYKQRLCSDSSCGKCSKVFNPKKLIVWSRNPEYIKR